MVKKNNNMATSVYKHPGFVSFVSARLMAVLATQMQSVVVAWQVYDLTRDPMALALVGLAQFVPMLLLVLPAGDWIDRFNRKWVLGLSWLVGCGCSLALWWLSSHGKAGILGIYAVLVVYGCGRAFSSPAMQSLLPQVVTRVQLPAAIAANSMMMRGAAIGGPLVGGFLYAYGGGTTTFVVCALCFGLATILLTRVPLRDPEGVKQAMHLARQSTSSMFERVQEGMRFIRYHPVVLGSISLDLFAVLLGGVIALLPIYAQEVLHVDASGLGILRSSMAVGEVLCGLYLSTRPFNQHIGRNLFVAVTVFGIANLVFAFSHVFLLSCVALFVAGAADMVSVYIRSSMVQLSTPDEMRGRVNSVNSLFISSSNELGEFRAGSSAALFGVVPAAVMGGVCTLVVVGLWSKWFPSLRHANQFADVEHPSKTK